MSGFSIGDKGIGLPRWTTVTRPVLLLNDFVLGFNTTLGSVEYWNGTAWVQETPYRSGETIQTVLANDVGGSSATTSYASVQAALVSITPKSLSSRLLIEVTGEARSPYLASNNPSVNIAVYENTTATLVSPEYLLATTPDNTVFVGPLLIRALLNNTSLATRSFGAMIKNNQAPTQSSYFQKQIWSIKEIKT